MNLFPSGTAYDCKIDANDEITWDGTTNFTVKGGPFYFDGSISLAGQTQIIYTGSAAIFFSGTISHERAGMGLRRHGRHDHDEPRSHLVLV